MSGREALSSVDLVFVSINYSYSIAQSRRSSRRNKLMWPLDSDSDDDVVRQSGALARRCPCVAAYKVC